MNKKTILIVGTADTKDEELQFMKACIQQQGGQPVVMDVGVLGDPTFEVEYSKHEVAAAANTTNQAIIDLGDENKAMTKTAEGACKLARQLCDEGKIDGVIMLGGTMGTDLSLDVADALPFGFPKFIVSTVAFSHLIPPDRLSPDLMMILWSGGLYGLNSVCKAGLSQACGAVLGAAKAVEKPKFDRPVVGMTSLGSSALTYMKTLKPELEKRGFEAAIFHTTGQGGRALENLSSKKRFACVMDFSVPEVINGLWGSIVNSGKDRLENAGKAGIPQIVCPGAAFFIDFPTWQPLPEKYSDRPYHAHNRLIASITLGHEQVAESGRFIASKLNKSKENIKVILPQEGLIEWDREGEIFHDKEALAIFNKEIKANLEPHVDLIELDAHICDAAFCDKVLEIFDAWVADGTIKK